MRVLIPTNPDFNYEQCKKLFEDNQHLIEDYEKFDDVIKNTSVTDNYGTTTTLNDGTAYKSIYDYGTFINNKQRY